MGNGVRESRRTPDLLAALGYAVFERRDPDSFQPAGEAPEWWGGFHTEAAGILTCDALAATFPYLEVFLADAAEHWDTRQPGRLVSEIWTQSDAAGKERRLRASAIQAEDRALLLIEPAEVLFNETQGLVQHAHDVTLAYDRIARLSRALAAANEELDVRNREVERATRAKSEFLARMSHEIRTPMNAILGMADLLWETPLSPEQREYVRVFRRAGDNLLNLINDILDLSKVESGQMALDRADFNLHEVLEKALEVAAVRAHGKGLELSCRIGADVPAELTGDAGRLRQIVLNLLGNSIKFTGRGEVTVRVERDPGRSEPGALRFCVRDTGIGIAPGKLGTIFESFTQADSSIHGKYGGTGLGLSISKSFAELMGGRMWVESTLGAGSAFSFTAVFQVSNVPPAIAEGFAGLRCLVAGGNANHRATVIDILTAWGALAGDSDGTDLIDRVDRAQRSGAPYSLVLLDADISGADSFRLAQVVRESDPSCQVLVMLRTGRPGDAARCRQLGLPSLLKPVRRSELIEVSRSGATVGAAQPADRASAELEFQSTRILLADDSEDNRFLIRSYLKNSGCLLDEAVDGLAAVEKFKASTYQLVLTDVEMPGLDGYTASRQMRQWERENGRGRTPILALTAHALTGEARKSADAGCDAHLTKPIAKSVLMEAIRRHALADAARGIRTVVDGSLRDIVPGYLANRRADVVALRTALDQGDFATIRMTAHKMKGTGGGYGFPVLTELGGAIETAALSQDGDSIGQRLLELGRYLEQVEVEYQ
jgi:signal transduction histidine kinase/CheY-like chemotaxis protein